MFEPPQLRPEGLALKNGVLYVSGDWQETQNQIIAFGTNFWGELTYDDAHTIRIPLSNPPPTTTPNNQWWGPGGMTFNTGATGVGAGRKRAERSGGHRRELCEAAAQCACGVLGFIG